MGSQNNEAFFTFCNLSSTKWQGWCGEWKGMFWQKHEHWISAQIKVRLNAHVHGQIVESEENNEWLNHHCIWHFRYRKVKKHSLLVDEIILKYLLRKYKGRLISRGFQKSYKKLKVNHFITISLIVWLRRFSYFITSSTKSLFRGPVNVKDLFCCYYSKYNHEIINRLGLLHWTFHDGVYLAYLINVPLSVTLLVFQNGIDWELNWIDHETLYLYLLFSSQD